MPNLEDAAQVAERASENARKRVADFAGNQEAQIKFYALESFGKLIAADIRKLQNGDGEIERLERAVIEAAIEYVEGGYHDNNEFDKAVRALIAQGRSSELTSTENRAS